jgi:hypothetical protein
MNAKNFPLRSLERFLAGFCRREGHCWGGRCVVAPLSGALSWFGFSSIPRGTAGTCAQTLPQWFRVWAAPWVAGRSGLGVCVQVWEGYAGDVCCGWSQGWDREDWKHQPLWAPHNCQNSQAIRMSLGR